MAISTIEHHCVLHAAEYLQSQHGFEMRVIPVDRHGIVDLDFLASIVDDALAVVSVQYANNEVGTVQPIAEIGRLLEDTGAVFHTDAVQAAGALSLGIYELGVDLLSIAAHKFYGPKGVGALYVREGSRIVPQIQGGSQERNRRAGTENVALIVGLAAALAEAQANRETENRRNDKLSARVRAGLAAIDEVSFNGHPEKRLPNNTNVLRRGHKRRVIDPPARPRGDRRVQRVGLHLGFAGAVARAAGDGSSPRPGAGKPSNIGGARQRRISGRFVSGGPRSDSLKAAPEVRRCWLARRGDC